MIYYGEFRTLSNDPIDITIITGGDTSDIIDLQLAENPVTINSVSENLLSPIKSDTATIRILTEQIYSDMYSSTFDNAEVIIEDLGKDKVIFRGYLTPNIYSQDYTGLDTLELEAVSAISVLKNIKYKETADIVNWYDLIKKILYRVGYDKFYLSDTYKYTLQEKDDLLKKLYQFEGNFFDNDEERTPWTYYEILEEFCKYFCYSLVVYESEVYFIDYKNLSKYKCYNLADDTITEVDLSNNYTITKDSYKETGAKISYDDTYNKIAVKDNLYEVDDIISNPMEDLVNQNKDTNKFYEQKKDIDGKNITYLNAFFKSKEWDNSQIVTEITVDNIETQYNSSFWQKVDNYETEEEPSSLNWKTYFTATGGKGTWGSYEYCMLRPKIDKDLICNRGYFVVNLDYKLSTNFYANDCFNSSDQLYARNKYCIEIKDTMFPCRLYVGEYYYDGEQWIKKSEFKRKEAKGYYKQVSVMTRNPIPTWYKYKDKDGDWKFCDKAEWDKATTEKLSGQCEDSNNVYYYTEYDINNHQKEIYVDKDFYNESKLKDRFYLVHKNKEDEKIFDTEKSLTNTVSWRMNMVDSEDGVAIKLPDFLLNGKLTFDVFTPTSLNDYGQFRTDIDPKIVSAVHITKLELLYKVSGKAVDIFEGATLDDDVVYTNVINDDFVNEWDEMELKVNTQVEDRITSLSSMLYKPDPSSYYQFLDKVYDGSTETNGIPENSIVQRYYDHYKSPKIILEASLENKINPFTVVTESILNKNLVLNGFELDVRDEVQKVTLIEI